MGADHQGGNAVSSRAAPAELSRLDRPALLDGPGSPKEALRRYGLDLHLSFLQFGQGLVSGDGDHGWEYGGKLHGKLTLDGAKLGLWEGFSLSLIGEFNYGTNVNGDGGTLLPVNTALGFPQNGGAGGDLSLTLTQRFGTHVSLSVGKFNMIDAASRTPLLGGGGIDTFWHVGLAAPVSGVVPPYVTGASLTITTQPAQLSLLLYDPRHAQQTTGLENWGEDGVTGRLSATFPVKIAGRVGYHSLQVVGSSKTGTDLADIPELLLPPGSGASLGIKQGSYYVGYSVQQYLWENPHTPGAGWGIFGQVGFTDGNPNPFGWMMLAGLGGTGLIPGRSLDRFGAAYFRYSLSNDLTDGLRVFGLDVGDEHGGEIFYNAAVTPWCRLTGDLQIIAPANKSRDTAMFAGLSAHIKF